MSREDEVYIPALEGKDIPILTLDHKWQMLFGKKGMSSEIREMADQLQKMIDRQSELREKSKEIKRLKNRLMGEIIGLRDRLGQEESGPVGQSAEKKLNEHTRLIAECNDKLEAQQDELIELPRNIYQLNYKLMLATMQVCYERMHDNTEEINRIDAWLREIRVQLKKEIIHKQEGEIENFSIYSYMHQIFGPEVIEIFDMKYDPDKKHPIRTPNRASKKAVLE